MRWSILNTCCLFGTSFLFWFLLITFITILINEKSVHFQIGHLIIIPFFVLNCQILKFLFFRICHGLPLFRIDFELLAHRDTFVSGAIILFTEEDVEWCFGFFWLNFINSGWGVVRRAWRRLNVGFHWARFWLFHKRVCWFSLIWFFIRILQVFDVWILSLVVISIP